MNTDKEALMAEQNLVLASVAARVSGYALTSLHRAHLTGRVTGARVGRRLYVNWSEWRAYAGALAPNLPTTALDALEADRAR